ncbi:hypothetical protein K4A83_06995 [Spirulina subsalsa FACHB-351]|uniref:Uncharacterized protein n=1 Tax=Spirulina subsalsa FACHB-351 TaxID=234711 RepID=A0ABT3L3D7_9CYAN|nr:hypothetical protein [Spirulina subsalsa]MCW6036018.1 hypothetical protein [Spirulina subsalsa FACHB-351]
MLLEKAQQLSTLADQKIQREKYVKHRQGFESRQKQIENAIASLEPLDNAVKIFRDRGLADFDVSNKADQLLGLIIQAKKRFEENPEWIIENNNFDGNRFKSSIDSLAKSLRQHLERNWKQYLAQQMPSTNDELLNLLAKIPSFRADVEHIQKLKADIDQVEFPETQSIFGHLENSIKNLKKCWEDLSGDDVPEAVLIFLRRAADPEGATLDLLTPEVTEWLDRHQISQALRIRLL